MEEEQHVKKVLQLCKYPGWAIQRVENQLKDKREGKTKEKKDKTKESKSNGSVTIPYVMGVTRGVTERVCRIMKKHGITTSAKPHRTLRQILVHLLRTRSPTVTSAEWCTMYPA
mgnify:CR=1 FL=1